MQKVQLKRINLWSIFLTLLKYLSRNQQLSNDSLQITYITQSSIKTNKEIIFKSSKNIKDITETKICPQNVL